MNICTGVISGLLKTYTQTYNSQLTALSLQHNNLILRWWAFSKLIWPFVQDFKILVLGGILVLACITLQGVQYLNAHRKAYRTYMAWFTSQKPPERRDSSNEPTKDRLMGTPSDPTGLFSPAIGADVGSNQLETPNCFCGVNNTHHNLWAQLECHTSFYPIEATLRF